MRSRWNETDAQAALACWGTQYGRDLALQIYASRLIGTDPDLVLHGGGNTSVKAPAQTLFGDAIPALFVKASGCDLGTIAPADFIALDLAPLHRLRQLTTLSEAAMTNQLRVHRLDASAPSPSVETLLHAFLPHRFVDHSHSTAVLCLSNQVRGEALTREATGGRVGVLPYVTPGFPLAVEVLNAFETQPDVDGIIVAKHGLFTFSDDVRAAYERHIEIVEACERFLARRRPQRLLTPAYRRVEPSPGALAARVAPALRGLLSEGTHDDGRPSRRLLLEWRADDQVLAFVNSAEAEGLAATGPLTPDHVIRTKPFCLYVRDPVWEPMEQLRTRLAEAVHAYVTRYEAYVNEHLARTGRAGQRLDPFPRVILVPGAGLFCFGPSKREAEITADLAVQAMRVKAVAHAMGGYEAATAEHLCEMEYWTLQQAKLRQESGEPLKHQVVLITGAAGAIGYGIAKTCAEAGAHLVLADIDGDGLARVIERVAAVHGRGRALALTMDVTNETSVHDGFDAACRHYGGVDVVVANAGIAHVAPVAELRTADAEKVLAVNFIGTFLTIREGVRVLRAQGLGGHIIINSSKNVFGPGKDFGAYSASKAAGHQLGKVSAIELAAEGIRVNMINADAIFGEDDVESGLWATVGPNRARSRKMTIEELPEFYRNRNLLHARVSARHVGNAVVFFASNQTPTTGATLPVDGGVVEAFPR